MHPTQALKQRGFFSHTNFILFVPNATSRGGFCVCGGGGGSTDCNPHPGLPNGQSHSIKCSTTNMLRYAQALIYIIMVVVVVSSKRVVKLWCSPRFCNPPPPQMVNAALCTSIDLQSKELGDSSDQVVKPLSRLAVVLWSLICAKNTTFAVSFYLRILPSASVHRRFQTSAFKPSVIRFR